MRIIHGSRGGPAGEWRQSRRHQWLEEEEIENNRERGILEVERARASYMVAEVGQQENGNRADSTAGENKRGQRTMEKEGAWRLKERENHTYMIAEVGQQENGDRADSTTGLNKRGQRTR